MLESILSLARELRHEAAIANDPWKLPEILGVIDNLEQAIHAVKTGMDKDGDAIRAASVGAGLEGMADYMVQHGIWFRLLANSPKPVQEKLDRLQDGIREAAKSLKSN